jgi:pimeloyl-ACP methyl ester carboxylesterase
VTGRFVTVGVGAALAGAACLAHRQRRDVDRARLRLVARSRSVVVTDHGRVQWAEQGSGEPLLVSHGIFHGFDGGLLAVEDLVVDRRIIAPSRFGYLGSDRPAGATVATQADAFAALLDRLGLDAVDVIGISAGTGAAVQLALRHPRRVRRLVISSGNFPGSPSAQAPPGWARLFYADWAMWAIKTFARPMLGRLMGVPPGFPRDDEQSEQVERMVASIFPVGLRSDGAVFDAYRSNPEIAEYPLEQLDVPTLIVHARDDPLASHEAAARAASRIPGATLVSLDSGGHLQLGQTERVRAAIADFLAGRPVA